MRPFHRFFALPVLQICICGSVAAHVGLFFLGPLQGPADTVAPRRAASPGPVTVVGLRSPTPPHADPAGLGAAPSATRQDRVDRPILNGTPSEEVATQDPADGLDGYIPRPLLSLAPELQQPLLLAWPEEKMTGMHCRGILHLFIDEAGLVQRVLTIEGQLPPAFEQVAHQAFLGARYTPGEVSGTRVKSLIRVEVAFDEGSTQRSDL